VYKIGNEIKNLKDGRTNKKITTTAISFVVLIGFMLKIRSFNQLDDWLENKDLVKLVPKKMRLPRIDAVRDSLKQFNIKSLGEMQNKIVRQSLNNKLVKNGTIDGYKVVGMDGVELFESTKKSCDNCLKREINGVTHYYHRAVVAAYVGADPHLVLGEEMLLPKKDSSDKGEGEQTAAKRLLHNLDQKFHKFADIVVYDALLCNAPWLNAVKSYSYLDAVVRVKDERLKIVKKAREIFDKSKHEQSWDFSKDKNNITHVYAYQTSVEMQGVGAPVRFVQFIEVKENLKSGKKSTSKIWIITTSNVLTLETLWKIIHARWGIENNVFRQLKTQWHMDHCFVHDEIAMEAVLKFMIIAFNLMQLFFFRRLKNFRLKKLLQVEVVERIIKQLIVYDPMGNYIFSTA
jgi:hypothetical protein